MGKTFLERDRQKVLKKKKKKDSEAVQVDSFQSI